MLLWWLTSKKEAPFDSAYLMQLRPMFCTFFPKKIQKGKTTGKIVQQPIWPNSQTLIYVKRKVRDLFLCVYGSSTKSVKTFFLPFLFFKKSGFLLPW